MDALQKIPVQNTCCSFITLNRECWCLSSAPPPGFGALAQPVTAFWLHDGNSPLPNALQFKWVSAKHIYPPVSQLTGSIPWEVRSHPGQHKSQRASKRCWDPPASQGQAGGWCRGGGVYQGTQQLTPLGAATSAEDFGESSLKAAHWR